jgi:hypothetical protein
LVSTKLSPVDACSGSATKANPKANAKANAEANLEANFEANFEANPEASDRRKTDPVFRREPRAKLRFFRTWFCEIMLGIPLRLVLQYRRSP